MDKLTEFHVKATSENPATIIITGDFNARSPFLWEEEKTQTKEGNILVTFPH